MNWDEDYDFEPSEPEYDYEDDDDDDDSFTGFMDEDGKWYNDPEEWRDSGHFNPPGTIDCGDGYVDDDGVFYEY